MSLPYPPPWQDKATLCLHICKCERTVDAWVKAGILPPPRMRGGSLMWEWKEVDAYLRQGGAKPQASAVNEQEEIRAATEREANVRAHA